VGAKTMSKKVLSVLLLLPLLCVAAPQGDYQFKSPSFNGNGYSSHVLTIENQEYTRQQAQIAAVKAAADAAIAASNNTNLSKFMNNLESRIYAQISQNIATAMFANNGCSPTTASSCQGSVNFQGNQIGWQKVNDALNCTGSSTGQCIQLSVQAPGETTPTYIYVPLSSFVMPGQ